MIKQCIAVLFLLGLASALTVQVNNIHFGYRNNYLSELYTFQGHYLTLKNYQLTKEQLTPDVLGFVQIEGKDARFDLNELVREFEKQDLDPEYPQLMFRFIARPEIILSISSENNRENEAVVLGLLLSSGRSREQLQL